MFDDFQPELLFADFIKYSSPRRRVDNTGESDFATDIKASIPAAKFRALKQRGLI